MVQLIARLGERIVCFRRCNVEDSKVDVMREWSGIEKISCKGDFSILTKGDKLMNKDDVIGNVYLFRGISADDFSALSKIVEQMVFLPGA